MIDPAQSIDVYFHPGRNWETFRLWRPLDARFNAFVDFLLSEGPSPPTPFPFLASDCNLHHHDPWDAIALHHIFRDPWERKVSPTKPPERDVRSTSDYPELIGRFAKLHEACGVDKAPTTHQHLGQTAGPDSEGDGEGDGEVENSQFILPSTPPASTDADSEAAPLLIPRSMLCGEKGSLRKVLSMRPYRGARG